MQLPQTFELFCSCQRDLFAFLLAFADNELFNLNLFLINVPAPADFNVL